MKRKKAKIFINKENYEKKQITLAKSIADYEAATVNTKKGKNCLHKTSKNSSILIKDKLINRRANSI